VPKDRSLVPDERTPLPSSIFGLPIHPLIVHATVVIVPSAALAVLLAAVVPRFRAWAGPLPMVLALVGLVLAPLSTATGENLEHQVGQSNLVEKHAALGDTLVWVMIPLAVTAVAMWWLARRGSTGRGLTTAVSVLAVLASIGTVVDVGLIGHSGAEAAWSGLPAAKSGSGG
jgi:uncharacterized membrane protein